MFATGSLPKTRERRKLHETYMFLFALMFALALSVHTTSYLGRLPPSIRYPPSPDWEQHSSYQHEDTTSASTTDETKYLIATHLPNTTLSDWETHPDMFIAEVAIIIEAKLGVTLPRFEPSEPSEEATPTLNDTSNTYVQEGNKTYEFYDLLDECVDSYKKGGVYDPQNIKKIVDKVKNDESLFTVVMQKVLQSIFNDVENCHHPALFLTDLLKEIPEKGEFVKSLLYQYMTNETYMEVASLNSGAMMSLLTMLTKDSKNFTLLQNITNALQENPMRYIHYDKTPLIALIHLAEERKEYMEIVFRTLSNISSALDNFEHTDIYRNFEKEVATSCPHLSAEIVRNYLKKVPELPERSRVLPLPDSISEAIHANPTNEVLKIAIEAISTGCESALPILSAAAESNVAFVNASIDNLLIISKSGMHTAINYLLDLVQFAPERGTQVLRSLVEIVGDAGLKRITAKNPTMNVQASPEMRKFEEHLGSAALIGLGNLGVIIPSLSPQILEFLSQNIDKFQNPVLTSSAAESICRLTNVLRTFTVLRVIKSFWKRTYILGVDYVKYRALSNFGRKHTPYPVAEEAFEFIQETIREDKENKSKFIEVLEAFVDGGSAFANQALELIFLLSGGSSDGLRVLAHLSERIPHRSPEILSILLPAVADIELRSAAKDAIDQVVTSVKSPRLIQALSKTSTALDPRLRYGTLYALLRINKYTARQILKPKTGRIREIFRALIIHNRELVSQWIDVDEKEDNQDLNLDTENQGLEDGVIRILEALPSEINTAIDVLRELMIDVDPKIRRDASGIFQALAVSQLKNKEMTSCLLEMTECTVNIVREVSINALGQQCARLLTQKKSSDERLSAVIKALTDNDKHVRSTAIEAIILIANSQTAKGGEVLISNSLLYVLRNDTVDIQSKQNVLKGIEGVVYSLTSGRLLEKLSHYARERASSSHKLQVSFILESLMDIILKEDEEDITRIAVIHTVVNLIYMLKILTPTQVIIWQERLGDASGLNPDITLSEDKKMKSYWFWGF